MPIVLFRDPRESQQNALTTLQHLADVISDNPVPRRAVSQRERLRARRYPQLHQFTSPRMAATASGAALQKSIWGSLVPV
jgi:hypothetical protein